MLGDEYTQNTGKIAVATRSMDHTERQLHGDSPAEMEADQNIQMLVDFINNGKRNSNVHAQYVEDLPPETPHSESMEVEEIPVVKWHSQ